MDYVPGRTEIFESAAQYALRNEDRGGRWYSRIVVSPECVLLAPRSGKVDAAYRVRHTEHEVLIVQARLHLIWNTYLIVHDPTARGRAVVSCFTRRRLVAALRGAGFEPRIVKTWFDGAWISLYRSWPLQKYSRD